MTKSSIFGEVLIAIILIGLLTYVISVRGFAHANYIDNQINYGSLQY